MLVAMDVPDALLSPRPSYDDELRMLVQVLPEPLQDAMAEIAPGDLLEIVMDLGRLPEARTAAGVVELSSRPVSNADIDAVLARVSVISGDNRAGIERTLHRISAIRNRRGEVIGLTLRVGRAIFGTIDMIRDLVDSGQNLLLLGPPGVGKTTKLREVARVLADDFHKRVIVVDTSNEIGGDGDVPHPGIGAARRMQVARPELQHAVMIEAVENHMPEAIIVDEIGTSDDAAAARTIAERGVQLVATAHGNTLENLVLNPTLADLVGGVHTVTLSDEEAKRRRTQKTITERKSPPTFDVVIELVDREEVVVHPSTADAVDRLLSNRPLLSERRRLVDGKVQTEKGMIASGVVAEALRRPVNGHDAADEGTVLRVYPYAVSRELLGRVLREMPFEARIVGEPDDADVVVALRARSEDARLRRLTERGLRVQTVKRNSTSDMRRALRGLQSQVNEDPDESALNDALREVEHAIGRVLAEAVAVSLAPRAPELRRVQHGIIERYNLEAESTGREPFRHLVIYPPPTLREH